MIDQASIDAADVARSVVFYDAALGALGLRRIVQIPESDGADGVGYGVEYPAVWIDRFHPHSFDVFSCVRCGGRQRVLAYVKGARGVRAILEHLGLPTTCASPAPARGPPQSFWC